MDFSGHDLNGLHLLYLSFEEHQNNVTEQMEKEPDINSLNFKDLGVKLLHFSYLAEDVRLEIQKRQAEKLLFSVEDMFRLVGQYDKYVVINFYRSSDAYTKYGDEVHCHLIYGRKLRNTLTEGIAVENYSRTDGKILIDTIGKDASKVKQLKTEGFFASEIYSISTFNHDPNEVAYRKGGVKEIPNTITIPFESEQFSLPKMENLITSWKFEDGTKILDHELLRYYTNKLIIGEDVPAKMKEKYLVNENGIFKEQALVQMNSFALHHNLLDTAQKGHLNTILKMRGDRRLEILKKDLGITHRVFRKFKEDHSDEYRNARMMLLSFKDETLTDHVTQYPIYWDEERFVHIYGRHYVDYFINFSTYKGTHFQYSYKDIRRLVCLVLKSLKDEIELALSSGKQYDKYGDQGYYFNGNYYTLRVDANGRLMTFFPMS